MREFWNVVPNQEVLTAEMLKADPDKYGGLGLHMLLCIQQGVYSVPLQHGGSHVSANVQEAAAKRILADGGVDIDNEGEYWCSILNTKVYFKGTQELVPMIRGMF